MAPRDGAGPLAEFYTNFMRHLGLELRATFEPAYANCRGRYGNETATAYGDFIQNANASCGWAPRPLPSFPLGNANNDVVVVIEGRCESSILNQFFTSSKHQVVNDLANKQSPNGGQQGKENQARMHSFWQRFDDLRK